MADPFKLLPGLGYGITLTDFYGSPEPRSGEPHNSYITVLARRGVVGLACWLLIMAGLVHRWFLTLRRCRELGFRAGENQLIVLMVFFLCVWVLAIGEGGFEKPYNVIPFYFFRGTVLGLGLSLSQRQLSLDAAVDDVEGRTPREASERFA